MREYLIKSYISRRTGNAIKLTRLGYGMARPVRVYVNGKPLADFGGECGPRKHLNRLLKGI